MSASLTSRIFDCEQGSPDWHALRAGRVTGSRVADVVRRTKTGVSKMRETYKGELIAERLSGAQPESFSSGPMQWGKDNEDLARQTYSFVHGVEAQRVGFVIHPVFDWAGASPDSLAGDDGLIEIKCPNSSTQIATLLGAEIDPDYVKQMQWGMACAERSWCDFVSFDPRLPPEMQLHVIRVRRDEIMIAELNKAVSVFLSEVDQTIAELKKRFALEEAA